jgi:hypothetical protein
MSATGSATPDAAPPAPTAAPAPAPTGSVTQPPPPLFGFNDQSIGYDLAGPAADADLAHRGGANIERVSFDWRWAEPYQGEWNLSRYDALYDELTARGIKPVWVLMFSPHWTWDPSVRCDQWHQDCTFPPSPAHDADWRAMVDKVVRRYPESAGIEVWNEPNLYVFWRPRPDPVRYASLLTQTYAVAKAANPSLPVIAGAVTNSPVDGSWGMSEPKFIRTMLESGGASALDALSVHLYRYGEGTEDAVGTGLRDMRAVRDEAGLVDTPIWVTELGVSTTDTNPRYRVTEQGQADDLVANYRRLAAMPDIGAIVVHTLIERPLSTGATEVGYGLVRPDLTPKPAYCSLAVATGAADPCR